MYICTGSYNVNRKASFGGHLPPFCVNLPHQVFCMKVYQNISNSQKIIFPVVQGPRSPQTTNLLCCLLSLQIMSSFTHIILRVRGSRKSTALAQMTKICVWVCGCVGVRGGGGGCIHCTLYLSSYSTCMCVYVSSLLTLPLLPLPPPPITPHSSHRVKMTQTLLATH